MQFIFRNFEKIILSSIGKRKLDLKISELFINYKFKDFRKKIKILLSFKIM